MLKLEFDVDQLNVCIIIVLSFLLFLFNFFDVYYFVRLVGSIGYSMFFEKRLGLNDVSINYGICTTQDLDYLRAHMNNARYIRELDFARLLFYMRTGIDQTIKELGGSFLQTSCTARYRKPINTLGTFKITTKLIYWDEDSFYLEHQVITLRDYFVRAVLITHQKLKNVTTSDVFKELLMTENMPRLEPPKELIPWMQSLSIASEKLAKSICTTHDLDFVLKHMNNARFLRELDFARVLFYVRTGAVSIIRKKGGDILQSACSIRYRRTIPLFTTYKITTKLIYWDDNAMYLEHEFISLKDGFVRAVVMSQQKVVKMSVVDMVKTLLNEDEPKAPNPPEELKPWIESMRISSEKLRNTTVDKKD